MTRPPPDAAGEARRPVPADDRLRVLLAALEESELEGIWTLALRCKPDADGFVAASRDRRIDCISREWRAVHGHTVLNRMRAPHALPWKRILIDVADKLNPGWRWTSFSMSDAHSEEAIEQAILRMYDERIRQMWAKMKPAKREKLALALDAEFDRITESLNLAGVTIGLRSVTVTSLGHAISAGLLSGAGALALAQGAGSFLVGGLLGGVLYQLGLWIVVRLFGVWTGAQIVAGGSAATIGTVLVSAPAAAAFVANALMATSYRKTVPATLRLLTAHELRRQVANLEARER
jgi:hypothetical protein